ncbi:helix-turn-helix domain-containing protein [Pseudanabaena yagii]|uniref:Transposase family protein n=1 Tax=Pseudanabaena yagii GIHE-NHR1 TaxID=2722753 RepID=A0ABX1LR14_9CYAN|nr:helix-turn-helix domain-containing protein [Pseudanabaena yagii]NMF57525.1 transposase family protein [Pseudanabaena yagii GIHE-NHR1]
MAVKLALDEKQEILRLYRDSDATTVNLAKQFGISTSTVSRLLQELMPAEEYRQLVSQKQAKGKRGSRVNHDLGNFQVNQLALIPDDMSIIPDEINNFEQGEETAIAMDDQQLDDNLNMTVGNFEDVDLEDADLEDEDLEDDDESEDDLVDEDNLDLSEDELDFSEEDTESSLTMFADLHGTHSASDHLEILPLDEADLPVICYIVVDRIAEIITRPLKDFKDLGSIPPEESLSKTIPIFDNHRVARRFSHHNQRVIKFPSDLIHITRPKLVQKGITRILFSGQVYTLN